MSTQSGWERAEWDAAGNNFAAATDLGRLHDNTTLDPSEVFEDETDTSGQPFWAGATIAPEIHFTDLSKIAALEAKMTAEEPIDLRLTAFNGNTLTLQNVYVLVYTEFGEGRGSVDRGVLRVTKFRTSSTVKYD